MIPMRVLYIDDDEPFLYAAERCLSDSEGFAVDVTSSSADALLKVRGNKYDAIISEHAPPGIDGIGVLKAIRLTGDCTPFIVFTATGGEAVVIEALNTGANHYVRKEGDPVAQMGALAHTVRKVAETAGACCPPAPVSSELQLILDSSDESMVFVGPDRIITWANQPFLTSAGTDIRQAVGRHCYEVLWGRDMPCTECRIPEVISSGRSVSAEVTHSDGESYLITTSPVTGEGGRICGFVERGTDISVVKASQEAVRREKEKYNLLFQSANDMIYLHTMVMPEGIPGRILEANDAASLRMGYVREELQGMMISDLFDPLLDENFAALISEIGGKSRFVFEWRHVTKAGEVLPVEVSVHIVQMNGAPVALSIARDITERKEAEQALMRREQEYRDLVENINEGIFRLDVQGTFTYVSPAMGKLMGRPGHSPSELIGRNYMEFIYPDDRPLMEGHLQDRLSGATKKMTFRVLTDAGTTRWVLESSRPIRENGLLVGIQGVFLDVTDLKMMGIALRQVNKKLNILSGITRHDILNQITSMNLSLELVEAEAEDAVKRQRFFRTAGKIMANLERIITFTRDYEDLGMNEPEWQDVGAVINREAEPFANVITVTNEVRDCAVYADRMLGKVFANLIGNSVMHGGTVHAVTVSFEERGNGGCIIVADDGVGIPADMEEKIFSKGVGKNTGFGLFLSREILDLTEMRIQETGEPGKGARFEIWVPEGKYRRLFVE